MKEYDFVTSMEEYMELPAEKRNSYDVLSVLGAKLVVPILED